MMQSIATATFSSTTATRHPVTPSAGCPPDRNREGGNPAANRVAHQARERLGNTSYHFLRFVDCCFDDGVLTLRGRVPSFYLKQMAQSVLANIEGVDRIDNRVDVVSPRGLSSVR